MCKHSEIAWNGEVLPQKNLVEVMSLQAVDVNQWFLFETNSLGERPSVNPWRRRQSEDATHDWSLAKNLARSG